MTSLGSKRPFRDISNTVSTSMIADTNRTSHSPKIPSNTIVISNVVDSGSNFTTPVRCGGNRIRTIGYLEIRAPL